MDRKELDYVYLPSLFFEKKQVICG